MAVPEAVRGRPPSNGSIIHPVPTTPFDSAGGPMRQVRHALLLIGFGVSLAIGVGAQSPASKLPALTTDELFKTSKIWTVHLTFTPEAHKALMPPPAPTLQELGPRPPGLVNYIPPEGRRNGISGFRGIDFEYVHAAIDFEGRQFGDVAVRLKGNGSFTPVARFGKPSYKI